MVTQGAVLIATQCNDSKLASMLVNGNTRYSVNSDPMQLKEDSKVASRLINGDPRRSVNGDLMWQL
jgi:hypothetical protein